MQEITWEVQYPSPPLVLRYCKKCGKKMEYASSGLFRINAQRKYLDIWLIYKCVKCDTTWNVSLYTRLNPDSFSSTLLDRFHTNDEELVKRYAMDAELIRRNGGEVCRPEYIVDGDEVTFREPTRLRIKNSYPFQIRLSTILRDKLKLSQKAYENMVYKGMIRGIEGQDLMRCKLNQAVELEICELQDSGVK